MDLKNIIDKKYSGIIAISDIHAVYDPLDQAISYARKNNLFILFLGDLVDSGTNPHEVVTRVYELINNDQAVLTIGNHDDKYHRYGIGNDVKLKQAQLTTLYRVGVDRVKHFLDLYSRIVTNKNSNSYFYYNDTFFVHGGLLSSFYNRPATVSKADNHITLYGETTGKRLPSGFPEREYTWVDNIPCGYTVVAGHDRAPYNINLRGIPRKIINKTGGHAIFTDTGCGKGGHLTGTVFNINNNNLEFSAFESFK